MDRASDLADEQVSSGVSRVATKHQQESILERVGEHIHLLGANLSADADVVFAPIQVERIGDVEHVGATLERRKAAITQRPVAAEDAGGSQAAAYAVSLGLRQPRRCAGAAAVQVRACDTDLRGLASTISEGENVIENSVESSADLVDGAVRKDVSFRQRDIAPVVGDVLRAGESAWSGKTRRAARHEVCGLIVGEAGKSRVLTGEAVIQADIEFAFVQGPHRHTSEVDAQAPECWHSLRDKSPSSPCQRD